MSEIHAKGEVAVPNKTLKLTAARQFGFSRRFRP